MLVIADHFELRCYVAISQNKKIFVKDPSKTSDAKKSKHNVQFVLKINWFIFFARNIRREKNELHDNIFCAGRRLLRR